MTQDTSIDRDEPHSPEPELPDELETYSDEDENEQPPPYTPSTPSLLHSSSDGSTHPDGSFRITSRAAVTSSEINSRLKPLLGDCPPSSNRLLQIKRKLLPDTGAWLSKHSLYRQWSEGSIPFVWLRGNPGFGKTFLCGSIVAGLQARATEDRLTVAYFFFRDTDVQTKSFVTALKTLALQISQVDDQYGRFLYDKNLTDTDLTSVTDAWRVLFSEYFGTGRAPNEKRVHIVLDGIDEGFDEERVEFLQQLLDLQNPAFGQEKQKIRLRVLLAGRPYIADDFRDVFEQAVPAIQVSKTSNGAAIKSYVETRLNALPSLRSVTAQRRAEVADAIRDGADGMFLWCDLMLAQLSQVRRQSEISRCLNSPPATLDGMITRSLASIATNLKSESEARDLNSTLMWVLVCDTPPSLWDLDRVLAAADPEYEPPLDWETQLRTKYACFFSLHNNAIGAEDEESDEVIAKNRPQPDRPAAEKRLVDWKPDLWLANTTVSFCHAYIGEYFRKSRVVTSNPPSFHVGVDSKHADLQGLSRSISIIWCSVYKDLNLGWLQFHIVSTWKGFLIRTSKKLSTYDKQAKISAGKDMVKMFRDESMFNTTRFRLTELPQSKAVIKSLQRWYSDKDVYDSLEHDDMLWASASVSKPSLFFAKSMDVFARKWLKTPSAAEHVSFNLVSFIALIGKLEADEGSSSATSIDWANIEEIARYFQFEEDASWHWAVALALKFMKQHDRSKAHLIQALEIDPSNAIINDDLASAHDALHEYEKSIQVRERSIELLLQQTEGPLEDRVIKSDSNFRNLTVATLRTTIGETYVKLKQDSAARSAFEEALSVAKETNIGLTSYIKLLARQNQSKKILETLESLNVPSTAPADEYPPISRLSELLSHQSYDFALQELLLGTVQSHDRMDFLEAAYLRCFSECQQRPFSSSVTSLHFHLALLYEAANLPQKATGEWAFALKEKASLNISIGPNTWLRYASWHLNRALRRRAQGNGAQAQEHIASIERLYARRRDAPASPNFQVLALHLARWHVANGASSGEVGRDMALGVMAWALDEGTRRARTGMAVAAQSLEQALALLHDDDRVATELYKSVRRYTRADLEADSAEDYADDVHAAEGLPMQDHWAGRCRGDCREGMIGKTGFPGFPIDRALNVCRMCDARLCDECVAWVRASESGGGEGEGEVERRWMNACASTHDWIRVPPVPRVMVMPGSVLYRGRAVRKEEYLAGLRKDYAL